MTSSPSPRVTNAEQGSDLERDYDSLPYVPYGRDDEEYPEDEPEDDGEDYDGTDAEADSQTQTLRDAGMGMDEELTLDLTPLQGD